MKIHWHLLPLIIFIFLAYFFWQGLSLEPEKLPSTQIGKPLPDFKLPILGGNQFFTPKLMQGQVALLNIWASWCEACAEEQVFLLKLAHEVIPIYGINYKDKVENALTWLKEWGNPYRSIAVDEKGQVAINLGSYGTPETFLIDKLGIIRYRHVGILNEIIWKKEFLPRIQQLGTKG